MTTENCLKELSGEQRDLIANAITRFKTAGVPDVCIQAASRVRTALQTTYGKLYAGEASIPDDPDDTHDAQTYTRPTANGPIGEFAIHVDDDIFTSVKEGTLSLRDFANLLLHEGMHAVVDPSTGQGYIHPSVNRPPYPAPFSLTHGGSTKCVN